jgi:guanylate kinase
MSSKQKMLGNLPRGITFIVSAPSGTGKTTLVGMLTHEFDSVRRSITCTTRPRRHNEKEGIDYRFLSEREFDQKIEEGAFLEHVTFSGSRYGTLKSDVETIERTGLHAVLVIDTVGALALKKSMDAVLIFILPPSHEELTKRLTARGTECEGHIQGRLGVAKNELERAALYDYVITNDDLHVAYQILRSIFIAEEAKASRQFSRRK